MPELCRLTDSLLYSFVVLWVLSLCYHNRKDGIQKASSYGIEPFFD